MKGAFSGFVLCSNMGFVGLECKNNIARQLTIHDRFCIVTMSPYRTGSVGQGICSSCARLICVARNCSQVYRFSTGKRMGLKTLCAYVVRF